MTGAVFQQEDFAALLTYISTHLDHRHVLISGDFPESEGDDDGGEGISVPPTVDLETLDVPSTQH